jgi:hypothetical protein
VWNILGIHSIIIIEAALCLYSSLYSINGIYGFKKRRRSALRKVLIFLTLLLVIAAFTGCIQKKGGEICRYWNGYIQDVNGNKSRVSINFIGLEIKSEGIRILKANKLIIKGASFTRNIEFISSEGQKSSSGWVFTTRSTNPSYPYGIITITMDYENINGQIPGEEAMSTFYSEDKG